MKWMMAYLAGFVVFFIGIMAALWKLGVLDRIGSFWTTIIIVLAIGAGIMAAVAGSGRKTSIEVDRT
jgi:uncharacterized membrane-anchored protein